MQLVAQTLIWTTKVFHNIVSNQMPLIPLQHNDNYIYNIYCTECTHKISELLQCQYFMCPTSIILPSSEDYSDHTDCDNHSYQQ